MTDYGDTGAKWHLSPEQWKRITSWLPTTGTTSPYIGWSVLPDEGLGNAWAIFYEPAPNLADHLSVLGAASPASAAGCLAHRQQIKLW